MNNSTPVWAFIAGGVIGAVIALLFAPQSGEETREMLRENSDKLKDATLDKVSDVRRSAETAIKDIQTQMDKVTKETETYIQKLKGTGNEADISEKKTKSATA